jgi:lipoate-protein ligase A
MTRMLLTLDSEVQSGIWNMALDDLLLDWVRHCNETVWIVRTYRWTEPTVSLGVNQSDKDLQDLIIGYKALGYHQLSWVRRPTGGRAILHAQDVSYSIITNDPLLTKRSVHQSYVMLTSLIRKTMESLGLDIRLSGEKNQRAYTRSPLCFNTETESDIVNDRGEKIAGSAQCRRLGGLLQHGAVFIPEALQSEFSTRLFKNAQAFLQSELKQKEEQPDELETIILPVDFPWGFPCKVLHPSFAEETFIERILQMQEFNKMCSKLSDSLGTQPLSDPISAPPLFVEPPEPLHALTV